MSTLTEELVRQEEADKDLTRVLLAVQTIVKIIRYIDVSVATLLLTTLLSLAHTSPPPLVSPLMPLLSSVTRPGWTSWSVPTVCSWWSAGVPIQS